MFGYKLVNLLHPTMVLTKREISFETGGGGGEEGKKKRGRESTKEVLGEIRFNFILRFLLPAAWKFFFSLSLLPPPLPLFLDSPGSAVDITKRNETKRRVVDARVSKTR